MNKIKNLLCVMIAIFAFSASSYAVEVSVGGSLGGGIPVMRGDFRDTITETAEKISGRDKPSSYLIASTIDVMIEILPYLAIETGLGYDEGGIWYLEKNNATHSRVIFNNSKLYIPLMLRAQYEYKLGVTYASVGVKFAFPEGDDFLSITEPLDDNYGMLNSDFAMDVAFAIGQEFRLGDANYLGVRIGYDLNVISPLDKNQFADIGQETPSLFIDSLSFALTYRYAFGSKWKK